MAFLGLIDFGWAHLLALEAVYSFVFSAIIAFYFSLACFGRFG
jgi:hypothetical protein